MELPGRSIPRPTVIVADDQPVVREWLCRILAEADYECACAADGLAALDLIANLTTAPALVIADIRMPNMTGVELGRRLGDLHPSLPVLYTIADDRNLPFNAAQWIKTPFRSDQLLRTVRGILEELPPALPHPATRDNRSGGT
jgi:CheY-like chemotaxis protein